MGLNRLRDAGYLNELAEMTDAQGLLDSPEAIERDCLIVYEGDFESMDGLVTITEMDIDHLIKSHNSLLAKVKRLVGADEIPVRYYPPLQLDHSTSAVHTIGRLVGPLRKGVHTLMNGRTVPAVYGRVRILGAENVTKVRDGRWTHLSIGADFGEGRVSELTVTPFPAAGEASMLSKAKGENMLKKLMAFLTGTKKLSEKEAEEKLSKMSEDEQKKLAAEADEEEKRMSNAEDLPESHLSNAADMPEACMKHLMEDEKLSADGAKERYSKMSDDEKKELSAKLAAKDEKPEDKELSNAEDLPEARLAKRNPKLARLVKDFRKQTRETELSLKSASIQGRLTKLRSMAKITPAEISKIDIKKLSRATDETIETVLKSYEDREPVIIPGVMGSAKAVNLAEINKKVQLARLEAETRGNMPSKKKDVQLSQDQVREHEEAVRAASFSKEPPGYDQIEQLLDKGEVRLAKVAVKAALASGGSSGADIGGNEAQLAELTQNFQKLQAQFKELCEMIGE